MTKTTAKKEDSALGERIDVVARELEALDDHELLRELLRRRAVDVGEQFEEQTDLLVWVDVAIHSIHETIHDDLCDAGSELNRARRPHTTAG